MSENETNHWLDDGCARAFWDQHKAVPYRELLQDTLRWADVRPNQRWLDLGCGGGQLSARLWEKSQGRLAQIIAMDCAAVNERAIARLRCKLQPAPAAHQLHFVVGNLSAGLPQFTENSFDGIISGLAISYAEARDPETGCFTDAAYNRLFTELFRVLKPDGTLVFSVNVPEPRFGRIFWKSLGKGLRVRHPHRSLWNAMKMLHYGRWLCREAKRGRFHYLPIEAIEKRLQLAGFDHLRYRLSYADQAYVVSARKPSLSHAPYGAPHMRLGSLTMSPRK